MGWVWFGFSRFWVCGFVAGLDLDLWVLVFPVWIVLRVNVVVFYFLTVCGGGLLALCLWVCFACVAFNLNVGLGLL